MDCHGGKDPEADLDLEELSPDFTDLNQLEIWRLVWEQIRTGEMPPKKSHKPPASESQPVLDWLKKELQKPHHPHLQAHPKFAQPEYGNLVDHEALFDPNAGPVVPPLPNLARIRPEAYEKLWKYYANNKVIKGEPTPTFALSPLDGKSYRDYATLLSIDAPTTEALLRNAEYRSKSDAKHKIQDGKIRMESHRPKCNALLLDPNLPPSPTQLCDAVDWHFQHALRRSASIEELHRFSGLYSKTRKDTDPIIATEALMTAIRMQPEALFRVEIGDGKPDQHGRVRLSSEEIALSVSYALLDEPDKELLAAAKDGKLSTDEEVQAHIERIWNQEHFASSYKRGPKPRVIRFFRQFFGYHFAIDVFKDRPQEYPHQPETLVRDADFLVEHILKADQQVLKSLLTTDRFFVNYQQKGKSVKGKFLLNPAPGFIKNNNHKYLPKEIHQLYGLPKDWVWTAEQPVKVPSNQHRGMLTHPAWLVAWSGNFDNDVVRRGHWIQTFLLGGNVPDVPIDVDAQIPDSETQTLRERMSVTREERCWRCHRKMDPLGLPFEQFDHYGAYRTLEKEKPVETKGEIRLALDASLNGAVKSPFELIDRLANSKHVEQVFVRHAFRFFLGRNETLGDARTLQAAHAAYTKSDGSFRELVKSLLTSKSFLYRSVP